MIPKIAHFVYLNPKVQTLEDFYEVYPLSRGCIPPFMRLNPDWRIILWTHKKLMSFRDVMPYWEIINFLYEGKQFVKACDLLRATVLYMFGGLYCDADFFWYKPIPDTWLPFMQVLAEAPTRAYPEYHEDNKTYINNAFMMSEPKGSFVQEFILQYAQYTKLELLEKTSPALIFAIIRPLAKLVSPKRTMFLPYWVTHPSHWNFTARMELTYENVGNQFPESYGVHLYELSHKVNGVSPAQQKLGYHQARWFLHEMGISPNDWEKPF